MNETELRSSWKQEENAAHIHGWDFSHIAGRYRRKQTCRGTTSALYWST